MTGRKGGKASTAAPKAAQREAALHPVSAAVGAEGSDAEAPGTPPPSSATAAPPLKRVKKPEALAGSDPDLTQSSMRLSRTCTDPATPGTTSLWPLLWPHASEPSALYPTGKQPAAAPAVPSAAAVIRAAAAKDAAAIGFEVVPRSGRGLHAGGGGSSDSGDSSSDDEGRVANKAVLQADESSDDDEAFMDSLDAQGKVRCAICIHA